MRFVVCDHCGVKAAVSEDENPNDWVGTCEGCGRREWYLEDSAKWSLKGFEEMDT